MVKITGLSGFAGRNLTTYLENKKIVFEPITRNQLEVFDGDIIGHAQTIVHLAGMAHDLKKANSPSRYYEVNFDLTKKLYDAFLKSNAEKFIFISSVKAVADSVIGTLAEDASPNPKTHYGKSKLMAEEYIQSQTLPQGKSYYILRPCMIHGPGNKGNLNLLYQFVKKRIPYPLASFSNKRSFLSVENLCFVISELILRKDIESGVYHLADSEALSTNDVIAILSSSLKRNTKLWEISPDLVKLISRVGDILHLPLTTERLQKLTESYVVSNEKIISAINKPMPVSSQDGLKLTAVSFEQL